MSVVGFRRPIYETEADLENERRIGKAMARSWNGHEVKNKRLHPVDWSVEDNKGLVRAFLEVKDRRRYSMTQLDTMGGVMFQVAKFKEGLLTAMSVGLPFVFAAELTDGIFWTVLKWRQHDGVYVRGREDRDDPADIEPMILLRRNRFQRLS